MSNQLTKDAAGEPVAPGVRFLARPALHRLLCRAQDAVAVAQDLAKVAGGEITIRELSMAEVGVYNPAEYRDGAQALAIEWIEKMSGDIDLSGLSADERKRAIDLDYIAFSVNAGLVFQMWAETRSASWLKGRIGEWSQDRRTLPRPDFAGANMGDLRRV